MKDIHSDMTIVSLIDNATYAADTTPVALDRRGYEACEIVMPIGIGGITFTTSNKIEFVLTHSDDNVTFTNVADTDLLGVSGTANGIVKSLTAAKAAGSVSRFGYKGGKRYLKLLADFSGTHGTGTPISAFAILAYGMINPQAAQT